MKIVLYNESGILDVFTEVDGVVINGNDVTWSTGALSGVSSPYVIIADECEYEDASVEELVAANLASRFEVRTEGDELIALKRRQDESENAILALMEMSMMGGM